MKLHLQCPTVGCLGSLLFTLSLLAGATAHASPCPSPALLGPTQQVDDTPGVGTVSTVWTGSQYGLVWGASPAPDVEEVFFRRLDADGQPLGPVIQITDFGGEVIRSAQLVWNGAEYGLVFSFSASFNSPVKDIYFARLSVTGALLGDLLRLTDDAVLVRAYAPSIDWNGAEWGVAWAWDTGSSPTRAYFTRVGSTGAKLGPDTPVTTGNSGAPIVAWSGSNYGVLWSFSVLEGSEVGFSLLDSTGAVLKETTVASSGGGGMELLWTGSEFAALMAELSFGTGNYTSRIGRLDAAGDLIEVDAVGSNSFPAGFQLGWTGSEFGLFTNNPAGGNLAIYLTRVASDGSVLEGPLEIVGSATSIFAGFPVWNGSEYAMTLSDERSGDNHPYFARFGCNCLDTTDADDDGSAACFDCDESAAAIYPGAPEINDGIDNQCPDAWGFGSVDELAYIWAPSPLELCWSLQAGATAYELAGSPAPSFPLGCTQQTVTGPCASIAGATTPGSIVYYLVRPSLPLAGGWGQDSTPNERTGVCM